MKIVTLLSLVLAAGLAVGLVGCDKGQDSGGGAGAGDGGGGAAKPSTTVATVNNKCPLMGSLFNNAKVAPDLVREFEGKKIGFCCAGCPEKWDKLSDADKVEKLASVMAP
ncbi:MAG: hypothetical protein HN350_05320 [Phycisphaerales bacterium]|nr:hypothetical protein [Phycisphaerales bacterium]